MENHATGQTTARATVSETQVQTNLRFDPSYLSSLPGMLKLGAAVRLFLANDELVTFLISFLSLFH